MSIKALRLGTRRSKLALVQTDLVVQELSKHYPALHIHIVPIQTHGDQTDRPLAELGGKSLFTKEIEQALYQGDIDVAVHSLKDMEAPGDSALIIASVLPREDVRDLLVGGQLDELPPGARVGTCSPRRAVQLKALRPDLFILPIRGNVETRLEKLTKHEFDAIILAVAGLKRLGLNPQGQVLSTQEMLPAVGQGAIALQIRQSDNEIQDMLRGLTHFETEICVTQERLMLSALDGTCHTPIAGLATLVDEVLQLEGLLAVSQEKPFVRVHLSSPLNQAQDIGERVARLLKEASQ